MHSLVAAAVALALSQLTPLPTAAQSTARQSAEEPPPGATLTLVTFTGSGCPAGAAFAWMLAGKNGFEVSFDRFVALVGVGASPTDGRKFCRVTVSIDTPAGYTYAVSAAEYVGQTSLAEGATGTVQGGFSFAGEATTGVPRVVQSAVGPYDDIWRGTDTVEPGAHVWAPCGGRSELVLTTSARVVAGTSDTATSTSYVSLTGECFAPATRYLLAWQRC